MTDETPDLHDSTEPVLVAGDVEPGQHLLVTSRLREPRPRGLGLVILGIVVAVLAGYVGVLLWSNHKADLERQQLACQVQRLGGQAIGGVSCPSPSPGSSYGGLRPSPVPGPTVIMVPGPAGPAGPAGPRGQTGQTGLTGQTGDNSRSTSSTPRPRSSASPAATRRPVPSPSPTCRRPNPAPVGPSCLPLNGKPPA